VEFALVLPLLLTLVLGSIDWGWYFFVHQAVTNAAREGARAGTLTLPVGPAPDYTNGNAAEVEAETAALAYLENLGLKHVGSKATATSSKLAAIDGTETRAIQVEVSYPVGSMTGFLTLLLPANAKATAVMRWQ
jgi:Flp pilus assembly protein TadG